MLEKIDKHSSYVEDYLEVYVGIVAKGIKKFLSNTKHNNNYRKYLQGKHIGRFEIKPKELYINFKRMSFTAIQMKMFICSRKKFLLEKQAIDLLQQLTINNTLQIKVFIIYIGK